MICELLTIYLCSNIVNTKQTLLIFYPLSLSLFSSHYDQMNKEHQYYEKRKVKINTNFIFLIYKLT